MYLFCRLDLQRNIAVTVLQTDVTPMHSTVWIDLLVHCSAIIHSLHVHCCLTQLYTYNSLMCYLFICVCFIAGTDGKVILIIF